MHEMLSSSSSTSPVLPLLVNNARHQTTSTPLMGGNGNNNNCGVEVDAFVKTEKQSDNEIASVPSSATNNNKLENFLFQNSKPFYNHNHHQHQTFSFTNYLNPNHFYLF